MYYAFMLDVYEWYHGTYIPSRLDKYFVDIVAHIFKEQAELGTDSLGVMRCLKPSLHLTQPPNLFSSSRHGFYLI